MRSAPIPGPGHSSNPRSPPCIRRHDPLPKPPSQSDARILTQLRQAHAHASAGRFAQAIAATRRAIAKAPAHPAGTLLLAQLLLADRQPDQSLYYAALATQTDPASPAPLVTLGNAHAMLGQREDALASFDRALLLAPEDPAALGGRGRMLTGLARYTEADAPLARAACLAPEQPENQTNYGLNLLALGRALDACDAFQHASAAAPSDPLVLSNLALGLNYDPRATREAVFEAHLAYGRAIEQRIPAPVPFANWTDPQRPLRIGFLSGDFRRHSNSFFLLPLLDHLDRAHYHTTCYHTGSTVDAVTEQHRRSVDTFRQLNAKHIHDVARIIRDDRCDILVELAGHFSGAVLEICAHQPAPVVVGWLGYPNSTGLSRVGARLVDDYTDPASAADAMATERLVRIPRCFLCYRPDDDAPDPVASTFNDAFTFGSFNHIKKINPPMVELWAKVLMGVPGSRLLLKNRSLAIDTIRAHITDAFAAHDISADRLELLASVESLTDHLALYNRVDLALDTSPYCGTTTTCEAAWMGVPTVTLVGDRHASRVGLSINTALALPDLCAQTHEHFIETAAALAGDPARLCAIRASMRERIDSGPLRDEPGFARRFESALRAIWVDWCKGNP